MYKTIGYTDLRLHVFSSASHKPATGLRRSYSFTFGGWVFGDIRRIPNAGNASGAPVVMVLVSYRDKCRNGPTTTIMDEVADAKSAMRWVRGHANELGVDPSRIAAIGSSAKLLAAATALLTDFDDPADTQIDPAAQCARHIWGSS